QRRDASGADYFLNTGFSRQRGIEASINWNIIRDNSGFVTRLSTWVNYNFQHFRYGDFKQITTDFSGNSIPGTSPNTLSSGVLINT
ncbi:hypothetical protein Q8G48_28610, partial [Klebsiella pneumoniae]|uniref:hypothetical protein n=1 Tax=Klebsiella pneumoniae TaxID=573 RepID=UPI003013526D